MGKGKTEEEEEVSLLSPQKGKQELAAQMKVDVLIYGGSAGCLDVHTEYKTKNGWKYFYEFSELEEILCYNAETDSFFYDKPLDFIEAPCKDLYRLQGEGLDMVLSEEHCLIYWNEEGEICEALLADCAEDISTHPHKYIFKDETLSPKFVTEVSYYYPLDKKKYCFEVNSGYFLARRSGNTFITGNSGKSRLLLNKAGYFAHTDPNFEGVMFRRTTKPLSAAGGLFSEAKKLFKPLGVDIKETQMEIYFHGIKGSSNNRKGGNLKFTHLEHEKDAEGNHQGLQYSFCGFDELTHFEQSQFLYLIGRLRSEADGDSFCMATTNPDYDSWVYNWVSWYLTEDGYFDENKLGKIRYFLIVNDTPVFGDTEEELAEEYPELCYIENPVEGTTEYVPPLSFCFIGGTIFDNPALIKANPKYLSALKAQTEINRKRLLEGNWHARPEGSAYFDRNWLHKIENKPFEAVCVRSWDIASEEPSDKNRHPDYTASIKMYKTKENEYVIAGDFEPLSHNEREDTYGRYRQRPGQRNHSMIRQAEHDGSEVIVCLPVDPAAAGKLQFSELAKMFMSEGFTVRKDPMPSNKSKLTKFEPFSSACMNGMVSIVESSFGNKKTLDAFYKELESFDGERSTSSRKDDWADCCGSSFALLCTQRVIKAYSLPDCSSSTKYTAHKQNTR